MDHHLTCLFQWEFVRQFVASFWDRLRSSSHVAKPLSNHWKKLTWSSRLLGCYLRKPAMTGISEPPKLFHPTTKQSWTSRNRTWKTTIYSRIPNLFCNFPLNLENRRFFLPKKLHVSKTNGKCSMFQSKHPPKTTSKKQSKPKEPLEAHALAHARLPRGENQVLPGSRTPPTRRDPLRCKVVITPANPMKNHGCFHG